MSAHFHCIPVGVVVERRRATSPWAEFLWRPVAVLAGLPDAAAWTPLAEDGDAVAYYAGPAEFALYRSEADNYRCNLMSGAPAIWVTMHTTDGEPPCVIDGVTADPAEGEGWTEAGQAIVEAVAMPETVRDEVAAFAAQYPARPGFVKRQRNRADPEALARGDRRPEGTMGKDEAFLARWSRRKRNAAAGADAENNLPARAAEIAKPISRAAAETTPTAPLPPIESIEAASDITAFLAPGVPLELTRAALRRAWTADPAIRNFIGLSENAWDFNVPGGVPGFGSLDPKEIGRLAARVLDEPRVTTPTSASALVVHEPAPPVEAPLAVPTIAPRESIGASPHKNDQRKAPQGRPRHHHGGALPQ